MAFFKAHAKKIESAHFRKYFLIYNTHNDKSVTRVAVAHKRRARGGIIKTPRCLNSGKELKGVGHSDVNVKLIEINIQQLKTLR